MGDPPDAFCVDVASVDHRPIRPDVRWARVFHVGRSQVVVQHPRAAPYLGRARVVAQERVVILDVHRWLPVLVTDGKHCQTHAYDDLRGDPLAWLGRLALRERAPDFADDSFDGVVFAFHPVAERDVGVAFVALDVLVLEDRDRDELAEARSGGSDSGGFTVVSTVGNRIFPKECGIDGEPCVFLASSHELTPSSLDASTAGAGGDACGGGRLGHPFGFSLSGGQRSPCIADGPGRVLARASSCFIP